MTGTGRTRDCVRAGVVSRLVSGCLAGVVLGILGMHAFVQHCPEEHHSPTAMASSVVGFVANAAPVLASHATAHAEASAEATGRAAAVGAPEDGSLCDTLMLCAFLVLGAGAGLVLALRPRAGLHRDPVAAPPPRGPPSDARHPPGDWSTIRLGVRCHQVLSGSRRAFARARTRHPAQPDDPWRNPCVRPAPLRH